MKRPQYTIGMARLETQIPCLVLSEAELKAAATLGEWREDRHNLEAARSLGQAIELGTEAFPSAFKRYQRPGKKVIEAKGSLIQSMRKAFSIGEHHTRTSAVDTKDVVRLRPNIN